MDNRVKVGIAGATCATVLLAAGLGFAAGRRFGVRPSDAPSSGAPAPSTPAVPADTADPPGTAAAPDESSPVADYLSWLGRLEEARARTSDSVLPRLRQLGREMPRSEGASAEFAERATRLSQDTMQTGLVLVQRTPPAPCAALARAYHDLITADVMLGTGGMFQAQLAAGGINGDADPRAAAIRRRAAAEAGVIEFKEGEARRAEQVKQVNAELAALRARYPGTANWRVR